MSQTLYKFAAYAPDCSDSGAFERRLSVRSEHLKGIEQLAQKRIFQYGGILLSPESVSSPTADRKMVGSIVIIEAESIEAARTIIEADVYYTAGVWDKEKLVILPFSPAPVQTMQSAL